MRPEAVRLLLLIACAAVLLAVPASAQAPCEVPDNGTGTVDLPPPGCGYVSPSDLHVIIDGLPPGTQINVAAEHTKFFNTTTAPGGNLGGEIEIFDSLLFMQMEGTGDLSGFNRFISLPIASEVHTGPRTPGDSVQTFPNEMVRLQGQLFGDPDFDLLEVTGGSDFFPTADNAGQTTLTRLPNGHFNVDSFFDIEYRIDFQGAPGSQLDGLSGSTQDNVRVASGGPPPPIPDCVQPDAGGTVVMPPATCGYVSPDDFHIIVDGLPPGTDIVVGAEHSRFINIQNSPGGTLGGEIEEFDSELHLTMTGRGDLTGFQRVLTVPVACETHIGPRTPGDPVQDFDTDMFRLQGEIFGDPDFDLLRVTGGTGNGLPSPGHTTLTQTPGGDWQVDSFFDIAYRIEFQGAPGGALDGLSGITQDNVDMSTGQPAGPQDCLPPGDDTFPSTAKLVLQPLFDPGSDPFVVRLSSAGLPDTVIQRGAQVGDTIPTEMISLNLYGSHPLLGGPIAVQLRSDQPSVGELTNVVFDDDCNFVEADSFFDVWPVITVPGFGETWVTERAVHLERHITSLPPVDEKYENPFLDPILVVDQDTGETRAQLLYEVHRTDPPFDPGPVCMDTFLEMQVTIPSLGLFGEPLQALGPSTVDVGQPFVVDGSCDDGTTCINDADCGTAGPCHQRSAVPTEMLEMNLQSTGPHPVLGDFSVGALLNPPSVGQSTSHTSSSTYPMDAFFDIWVEMTTTSAGSFTTATQSVPVSHPDVRNIPPDPGTAFSSPPGVATPIHDESGDAVGDIQNVIHTVGEPRDWQPPPPPEDDCFDSWLHLQVTLFNPFCQDDLLLPGDFRVLHDAPQPGGSPGQEVIDTLIAKALFTGQSSCLGDLRLRLSQSNPSTGRVASLAPAEFFPANSFFDVWAVVDTGIGTLFAGQPVNMNTTINSLPPEDGEIYFGPGTVIPLFDETGVQVGEILEVSHKVHQSVDCPPGCLEQLLEVDKTDNGEIVLTSGIPLGGAGLQHDVVRASLAHVRSGGGAGGWVCLQDNGGETLTDAAPLSVGDGFAYLARDAFGEYAGTWNSSGASQTGNRDVEVQACTP